MDGEAEPLRTGFMLQVLRNLNGPQTIGNGRAFWIGFAVVLALAIAYPLGFDPYDVGNTAYFLIWIFAALGLSLMWGYTGILSFGQMAFFGIAGYGYGVLSINLAATGGMTLVALAAAIAVAALFAAVLGYFMIYGRVGGVFFGIVTFATTLALAAFMGQTAGPEWAIGRARFNGFNGMGGMPPLELPWFGEPVMLEGTVLYYAILALLLVVYLGLRWLVNGRFGNVLVAIREDPLRAELLGYDVRKYQLAVFVLGSALAALSGGLYTAWGQFITPAVMGLPSAAMPIIWVAFSGRGDLTATLVGTFVLLLSFQALTVYSQQYALILMGALLLVTVLFVPAGFIAGLSQWLRRRHTQFTDPGGSRS
jgi:branched-chain amino acid transport system permease protein